MMLFIWGFIVVLIIGIIFGAKKGIKQGNELKEQTKSIGALQGVFASHVEGLGIGSVECKIFRFSDRVLIDSSRQRFEIYLAQFRAAEVKSMQELIDKSKSVVGRAMIGTLLVPGLGTIVGGMSGIGNKKKTSHYMIFNFIDAHGELSAVTFQDTFAFGMKDFCQGLNHSLPTGESSVVRL
ncbi:hypothetical protein NSS64_05355 [Paenibacillus sp. FSL H8-0122]|uniref:hypothetical protein n=1 Tax=Paenibacillus sp. FSL H8-0122 TaxID=2954510 RepID=UPI0030FB4D2D